MPDPSSNGATKRRILIIDNDPAMASFLSELEKEGYELTPIPSGEEALKRASRQPPDLIITETNLPGMDGFALVRKLRETSLTAHVPILMLTTKSEAADRIAGFQAGVDDYVTKPFYPKEVSYRIIRLLEPVKRLPLARSEPGRLIAFFSPKGGVGKTTLSVNLAIAMRQRTAKSVALFDADFFFGNVGVQLNLSSAYSIVDFAKNADQLDQELADQVLARHESGVRVLLAPARPEEGDLISAHQVKSMLTFMAELHSYVIIDCQPSYDDRILAILDQADDVMLVVTPEIGPFRNSSLFLDMASTIGVPLDKIHVILNRSDSRVGIEAKQIEKTLNRPIECYIMSGGTAVVLSTNRGTPLVIEKPGHQFSRQIFAIADYLIKNEAQQKRTAQRLNLSVGQESPSRSLLTSPREPALI